MIDQNRLNAQIQASGYKKKYLARALGISAATLYSRLRGQSEFRLGEAQRLGFLLGLSAEEQARCFWTLK